MTKGKIGLVVVITGCAIGLIVWLASRGGGGSAGTADSLSTPSTTKATDTAVAGSALVIQLIEEHADTFQQSLGELEPDAVEPPFHVDDGTLKLADDVADVTNTKILATHHLTLGSPTVPLRRCGVLMICSTHYTGKGRQFDTTRYQAFERLPAAVDIPAGFEGEKFDYDMETAKGPLAVEALKVRLLPKDKQLRLDSATDGKFSFALGPISKTLGAGETAVLSEENRTIAVTEAAVLSRPIGKKDGQPVQITPRVDHGSVRFSSTLKVKLLGKYSRSTAVEPKGELP